MMRMTMMIITSHPHSFFLPWSSFSSFLQHAHDMAPDDTHRRSVPWSTAWLQWLESIQFFVQQQDALCHAPPEDGLSAMSKKSWAAAVTWHVKQKSPSVAILEWMMYHILPESNILSPKELAM